MSGAPPHLDADLRVVERHGCDLHPLDPADEDDADTLLGFIWPDQRERFERLRAALEVARRYPVDIARGDGIAWARSAAVPREGTATVLLHTVIVEHMTAEARASLRDVIDELAANAAPSSPFAWIRMELGDRGYLTSVTRWPGERETQIAYSDGHAQNIEWISP
jgi:hypothetical protein